MTMNDVTTGVLLGHNDDHNVKVHALVVAAGKGSRFGSSIPKQYTEIHGQTILQHTIVALARSRHISKIHLVVASDDEWVQNLSFALPVERVRGGKQRWQSVLAGVAAIAKIGKSKDLVVIHDAARPCIRAEDIDAVIEVAHQQPYGAILGVPCVDTLKYIDANGVAVDNSRRQVTIQHTVERSRIWKAQTPQVFRLQPLYDTLLSVRDKGMGVTDEASAFEKLGLPVKMVQGNSDNVKLTHLEDLNLIKNLLI